MVQYFSFLRHEFHRKRRERKAYKSFDLSAEDQLILESLRENGWAVVDLGLSEAELADMRTEIDALFEKHSDHVQIDKQGADKRLFGYEKVSPHGKAFHENKRLQSILDAYRGMHYTFKCTMAGRIKAVEGNLGSGGGWHRDTADFPQVKSIVYLSDVDETNGPFQYVEGSHERESYMRVARKAGLPWNERRFDHDTVMRIVDANGWNTSTVTAKAGSIVLADTSGLHRGMPIQQGTRYAYTNYIWYPDEWISEKIKSLIIPQSD